jgi:hypothetical protein
MISFTSTVSAVEYSLLEPLQSTTSYQVVSSGLGVYLADISQYLFMVIAVVSAFYLIYGGIQYLTTDMSSNRQQGKETIKRVIVGLIFIFSIWTVFNAINPDLLRVVDFGGRLTTGGPVVTQGPGQTPTPGTVVGCTEGLVNIPGTCSSTGGQCKLCASAANNLNNMIAAAARDGITLRVISAYRDVPSCNVAAGVTCAAAGRSMHEVGKAVDFDGFKNASAGAATDPRFLWLKNNASKYGFYNYLVPRASDEYNHWSTSGY